MQKKVELASIARSGQTFFLEAEFQHAGADELLTYIRETDGKAFKTGIRFLRARALQFRAEAHCTVWHIEDVYNTLAEVEGSKWVEDLERAQSDLGNPWEMHHFMVYVEDSGCYEVASESWEWIEEGSA